MLAEAVANAARCGIDADLCVLDLDSTLLARIVIRVGRQRCHPEERERRGIWVGDRIVRSAPTQIPHPRLARIRDDSAAFSCNRTSLTACSWFVARAAASAARSHVAGVIPAQAGVQGRGNSK
jgi:hypothetical protein